MKRLIPFLIIFLISPVALSGEIYFNRFDNSRGLPQINVLSIYQDETGAMWFGTTAGLCRYNGYSTQVFRSSPRYPGLTDNSIRDLTGNGKGTVYIRAMYDLNRYDIDKEQFHPIMEGNSVTAMYYRDGVLWIGAGDGVYTYEERSDSLSLYMSSQESMGRIYTMYVSAQGDVWAGGYGRLLILRADGTKSELLPADIRVNALYVDNEGSVWAGTQNHGVYVFDDNGSPMSHYMHSTDRNSISNNTVHTITEDELGVIWVGTFFGLNSFDKSTGEWTNYFHDDARPHSLSHSSVYSLYRDTQNTIWVGTYFGGVNYFNRQSDIFQYYNALSMVENSLSFPFVGNMTEDGDGNLWICTEGGGLNCLNLSSRKFTRYLYDGFDSNNATRYNLRGIYYDPRTDKLYVGVRNVGLYVFDPKTKAHTLVYHPARSVREIRRYGDDILLLSGSGLYRFDTDTNKIVSFSDDNDLNWFVNGEYINAFLIDSRNRLWLSHAVLKCVDLNTKERKLYPHDKGDPRSFGRFGASSMIETADGELFIGTLGSGLFRYDPATDDFDSYTEENKKQFNNFSYHISETAGGNIIILHDNAMTVFDPRNDRTIWRSPANFPISSFFENNSSYTTRSGEVFIGGANGLVSFDETRLTGTPFPDYSLYFDKLMIDGKYVLPGDETKILSTTLPLTDDIRLRHDQNNFSIEFATSNYSRHGTITEYEYKMEGLDREWNSASSNILTYTSVDPGKYRLVLREVDPEKEHGDIKTRSLHITISPPFHKTIFAYVMYALFGLALVAGTIIFFSWRYKIRTSLAMERKEKERNERMNEMKLQFFTGVSHEFRTPLTLIMAQVEHILSERDIQPALKRKISKVHDNAAHMRNLISELLDFRKAEQGYYRLKVEKVDMVDYIGDIYRSFIEYAEKHRINYVYNFPHEGRVEAYIDKAHLKKAVYNLLSNAFKYTPDSGSITVRLRTDDGRICIEVEDTGIGMSPDVLTRIFERFYQVEHRTSVFSLSTGIGLALVKEIVEAHRGEISVGSTLNQGSVFEIKLKEGSLHFDISELTESISFQAEQTASKPADIAETINDETDGEHPSILIVEDNEQLLDLLAEVFSDGYRVYRASNGMQGLEMAGKYLPDIILSDIMMPEMSGKEMCRRIKNDINMSHIPVVMLTALDSVDQTVEGLMFGADDYVTKPFNMEILKVRCNGIVRNRRRLYRNMVRSKELTGIKLQSEQEAMIIDKATDIIKANFDNPDFDMNMLASEMGIGRNKLYTNVKEITGMTPNEFTLVLKLRESTELLKNHHHLNVSEIAIKLGFSSAKYFSKCFKTFYGITPVQWRKENGGDNSAT